MSLLQITARMAGPVVLYDALHFDGLMVACHQERGAPPIGRASDPSEIARPTIPVASITHAGLTVYACSAAELSPDARRYGSHLTRRRDGADLDYLTHALNPRSGTDRDVMLRLPAAATEWVRWYAVGRRRPVKEMLRRCQSVGAVRRDGYGAVAAWEIDELDGPPALAIVAGGMARRHLPAAWCVAPRDVQRAPVRAPYWHSSSVVPAVRVGADVELVPEVAERLASWR